MPDMKSDSSRVYSNKPLAQNRIDVQFEDELTEWADEFGVTTDQLREAVAIVGDNPEKVANYLSSRPEDTSGQN